MAKVCAICGKEFETRYSHKRYCSLDCVVEAKRRDNKRRFQAKRAAPLVKKTCAICGKEFETRYSHKRYCSSDCAAEGKRPAPRTTYKRRCVHCGKEFETGWPWQVHCSRDCADKARYQRARTAAIAKAEAKAEAAAAKAAAKAAAAAKAEAKAEAAAAKAAAPAKKTLSEWAREAEECNLDYGTYRAMIAQGRTYEELKANAKYRHRPAHSSARRSLRKAAGD